MTRRVEGQHSNVECVVQLVVRAVAGSHGQDELLEVHTADTVSVKYFRVVQMG
jgi:hypothetical protein